MSRVLVGMVAAVFLSIIALSLATAASGTLTSREILKMNMAGKTVYLVPDFVRSSGDNYTWTFSYVKPAMELMKSPYSGYFDVISNYSLVIKNGVVNITSYVERMAWNKTGLYIYQNGTVAKIYKNVNVTMGYDTGWFVTDDVIGFVWKSVVLRDGRAYEYGMPVVLYDGKPFFVVGTFNATGRVGLVLKPVYGGSVVRMVTSTPYTGGVSKIAGQYNNTLVFIEGVHLYYYIVEHNLTFIGTGAFVDVFHDYFVYGDKVYNITDLYNDVVDINDIAVVKGYYVEVPIWGSDVVVADDGWVVVGGEKVAFYREINWARNRGSVWVLRGRYPFFSATVYCLGSLSDRAVLVARVVRVNESVVNITVYELPVVGNMTVRSELFSGVVVPVRDGAIMLDLGMVRLVLPLSQDRVKPLLEKYGLLKYVTTAMPSSPVSSTTTVARTTATSTTTAPETGAVTTSTPVHSATEVTVPQTGMQTTSAGSGGAGFPVWAGVVVIAIIALVIVFLIKRK